MLYLSYIVTEKPLRRVFKKYSNQFYSILSGMYNLSRSCVLPLTKACKLAQ